MKLSETVKEMSDIHFMNDRAFIESEIEILEEENEQLKIDKKELCGAVLKAIYTNSDLEEQIEKMKCCENCKNYKKHTNSYYNYCKIISGHCYNYSGYDSKKSLDNN